MAVRYIYFDLGNVILNFDHQVGCRQVATAGGLSQIVAFETIFTSGLQDRYESGEITCDEFWKIFCQTTGSTIERDDLFRAMSDIFWPNVAVFPIIARLAALGYPLGVLSNTCLGHWEWVRARRYAVISKLFDQAVVSFEHRSMKPDAKIYQEAIRRSGVSASEIFFIDDRLENVQGALKVGIDAVQFRNAQTLVRDLEKRGIRLNL